MFGKAPAMSKLGSSELVLSPPQDRIRDLYARCDVWLTASRSDGFNLPAIESMLAEHPSCRPALDGSQRRLARVGTVSWQMSMIAKDLLVEQTRSRRRFQPTLTLRRRPVHGNRA